MRYLEGVLAVQYSQLKKEPRFREFRRSGFGLMVGLGGWAAPSPRCVHKGAPSAPRSARSPRGPDINSSTGRRQPHAMPTTQFSSHCLIPSVEHPFTALSLTSGRENLTALQRGLGGRGCSFADTHRVSVQRESCG